MRHIHCVSLLPKNGTNHTAAPRLPSRNLAAKLINTGLPLPKLTMPSATGTWFVPARAGSLTLFKESGNLKKGIMKCIHGAFFILWEFSGGIRNFRLE